MIYITFNLNPCPCISVRPNILPPDILFRRLVVACPTSRFLVLALTAMPIKGAATLTVGFKNLFQALCLPLNIFCSFFFIDPPSSKY